jgi:hypothetical protein
MMSIGDVGYETWSAQVRECTAADAARAQPHLPGPQAELARRKPAVSIVGRLVPIGGDCTLMDCGPGACCNQCDFRWVVVPRDCPGRTLGVSPRESPTSMQGCGMDCALNGYAREADWVIVSGRIGGTGDVVVDADFCRLRSLAMIEAKNQLTDADLERLTSPASKRPSDDARCPPN